MVKCLKVKRAKIENRSFDCLRPPSLVVPAVNVVFCIFLRNFPYVIKCKYIYDTAFLKMGLYYALILSVTFFRFTIYPVYFSVSGEIFASFFLKAVCDMRK